MSEEQLLEKIQAAKANPTVPTLKVDIIQDLLDKVTKEKDRIDKERADTKRANEFIDKIFGALTKIHSRRIVHPRTKRFIGIKFKYTEDGYGKTIYDYLEYNKDPFELKILESLEPRYDENDQKDGGWIDKQINLIWLNKRYAYQ